MSMIDEKKSLQAVATAVGENRSELRHTSSKVDQSSTLAHILSNCLSRLETIDAELRALKTDLNTVQQSHDRIRKAIGE